MPSGARRVLEVASAAGAQCVPVYMPPSCVSATAMSTAARPHPPSSWVRRRSDEEALLLDKWGGHWGRTLGTPARGEKRAGHQDTAARQGWGRAPGPQKMTGPWPRTASVGLRRGPALGLEPGTAPLWASASPGRDHQGGGSCRAWHGVKGQGQSPEGRAGQPWAFRARL